MAYLPIENHGVIGDLRTTALVGVNGTIDWFCSPRFDSPSIFASLLDDRKGGSWELGPVDGAEQWNSRQLYLPDTNVLITRFLGNGGVTEVEDFMPVDGYEGNQAIVRRVTCVRGRVRMFTRITPAFDYARRSHSVDVSTDGAAFVAGDDAVHVWSSMPLQRMNDHAAGAEFDLQAGERVCFLLSKSHKSRQPTRATNDRVDAIRDDTIAYWRSWIARSNYKGRWREMVHRSALTLKLLTYAPTGALIAAATTSLPEQIGGERNWDYRYTWMRDASFSLYGLLRLGFTDEAGAFIDWLAQRIRQDGKGPTGPLQPLYAVDGTSDLPEETLGHLEGYRGSGPVRIGNAATGQLQHDIYGELIDSVYLYNKYGSPIHSASWDNLGHIIEWLTNNWDTAGEGIWETRGGKKHFTYSRLMSWVAFERMIRMARQRGLPGDVAAWSRERDAIYRQIMERGWSKERNAFVQHYESQTLDASVLMMPMVKFMAPTDPKWLSTLEAIGSDLVSDSLVYRYDPTDAPDGIDGTEGTFSMCSFWYVEALSRAGRVDEARLIFEKMLTYSNELGLYSEEIGPAGELLGNFPQAFTHLSLISAAFDLDRKLP